METSLFCEGGKVVLGKARIFEVTSGNLGDSNCGPIFPPRNQLQFAGIGPTLMKTGQGGKPRDKGD